MQRGKVKWFDDKKGYGFITPDKPSEDAPVQDDVFVHHSGVLGTGFKTLKENQLVEFKVIESQKVDSATGRKKLQAIEVKKLDEGPKTSQPA